MQWYIVHTYSGFEERVAETLRQRAEAMGLLQDPKLDAKKKPYEQVPKNSEGSRISVM